MPHQEPPERAEPGNGAFDDPAMPVAPKTATVLMPTMEIGAPIRAREHDAASGQPFAERIAVVGAVGDQMVRIPAAGGDARLQRRVDERDLGRRRRGNGDSHRNTLTLDQYHAL